MGMVTQVGIVSSTKKRPINIQEWLYWQWRYEQAIAKALARYEAQKAGS